MRNILLLQEREREKKSESKWMREKTFNNLILLRIFSIFIHKKIKELTLKLPKLVLKYIFSYYDDF